MITQESRQKKQSVCVVTVTYNRKYLLEECLEAILAQSYSIDELIIIDNASTDGTCDYLKEKKIIPNNLISYYIMKKNTGGAGGFYEGIRLAKRRGCDWIWVMDDDTIPAKDCLEKLIEGYKYLCDRSEEHISFLASSVYGIDNEFMNVPDIDLDISENGYPGWYKHLEGGMITLSNATFVSILINAKAVQKCGLPCRDYFIWGDDSEYTKRLTKYYGKAYLVGSSKVVHKRKNARPIDIRTETDESRIKNYHYLFRNRLINNRYYNNANFHIIIIKNLARAIIYLKYEHGLMRSLTVLRGTIEGIVQYPKFKRYIDNQLKNAK